MTASVKIRCDLTSPNRHVCMSPRQKDYDYTAIRFFLNCRRGLQLFSKKQCRSEEALEVKGNSEAGDSSFSNVFFC